ncbi:MAG: phosphoenolpyruvate--protein phosphotransferase [Fibromonadaceae bacterium]|jgi:phosphotransferase system enzyme I (PtsI)|nr:phosphoenolpyruvate--protein phosphotransferase [Fibromonadaceae bacterium]
MPPKQETNQRKMFIGQAASPGYVIAKTKLIVRQKVVVSQYKISREGTASQIDFFRKGIMQVKKEISNLRDITLQAVSKKDSEIFDSHLMILQDPLLIDGVISLIRDERWNAGYAFHLKMQSLIENFENSDGILKERAQDLKDIYNRTLLCLNSSESDFALQEEIEEGGAVLTGFSIGPNMLMNFDKGKILGLAIDSGSVTSHVSILARSMQIPAVMGLGSLSESIKSNDLLILDGTNGIVIVNPDENDINKYKKQIEVFQNQKLELFTMRDLEPITMDGKYIRLNANIERYEEASEITSFGASGVGLYRSEFLYFGRNALPTRKEQAEAYSKVVNQLDPLPVTIRTLDAGGDKMLALVNAEVESNPFMGWRSIRLCLDRKDIFRTQMKALIEAGSRGNLKIMFPMISSIGELEKAKEIYEECSAELRAEGLSITKVELGAMIEIPSAVIIIEEIAKRVDFLSIGTNDLIQFTLAVDRSNGKIASLYEPHHPAVLRSIKLVVEAAHKEGIPVSVCGEMASDPLSTLLLVGLGVDELSMSSWCIMECKKIIRSVNYDEARAISAEVLGFADASSINNFLKKKYSQKIKSLGISSFITAQDFTTSDRALIKIDDEIQRIGS